LPIFDIFAFTAFTPLRLDAATAEYYFRHAFATPLFRCHVFFIQFHAASHTFHTLIDISLQAPDIAFHMLFATLILLIDTYGH
jgi:hypothetical protein